MTNADALKALIPADFPLATVDDVRASLLRAKEYSADVKLASMMLRHGRLTDEARTYVAKEYPQ